MEKSKTIKIRDFIHVRCISTAPGNPIKEVYQRISAIEAWSPVTDDYIKMGASAYLNTASGTIFVCESFDEITELISNATEDED